MGSVFSRMTIALILLCSPFRMSRMIHLPRSWPRSDRLPASFTSGSRPTSWSLQHSQGPDLVQPLQSRQGRHELRVDQLPSRREAQLGQRGHTDKSHAARLTLPSRMLPVDGKNRHIRSKDWNWWMCVALPMDFPSNARWFGGSKKFPRCFRVATISWRGAWVCDFRSCSAGAVRPIYDPADGTRSRKQALQSAE
jgi:hypothetical protein